MQDFAAALNIYARDLREQRIASGRSQRDVAETMGLHQQHVSGLERLAANGQLSFRQLPVVLRYGVALGRSDAQMLRGLPARSTRHRLTRPQLRNRELPRPGDSGAPWSLPSHHVRSA